jgi:hypothetical protein
MPEILHVGQQSQRRTHFELGLLGSEPPHVSPITIHFPIHASSSSLSFPSSARKNLTPRQGHADFAETRELRPPNFGEETEDECHDAVRSLSYPITRISEVTVAPRWFP